MFGTYGTRGTARNLTDTEMAQIRRDVELEADMSQTPEVRGNATQDLGSIEEPVPAQLHGLTGTIRPMRDSFLIKGMVSSERVDAATSDLPDDVTTWTEEEVSSVREAISELQRYCTTADASLSAHPGR